MNFCVNIFGGIVRYFMETQAFLMRFERYPESRAYLMEMGTINALNIFPTELKSIVDTINHHIQ